MIIVPPKPSELDTTIYVPNKRIRRLRPNQKPVQYQHYEIDPDNWAAKGLKFFGIVVKEGLYDYVSGKLHPLPNATIFVDGKEGLVAEYDGTNYDTLTIDKPLEMGIEFVPIIRATKWQNVPSAASQEMADFHSTSSTPSTAWQWSYNGSTPSINVATFGGNTVVSSFGNAGYGNYVTIAGTIDITAGAKDYLIYDNGRYGSNETSVGLGQASAYDGLTLGRGEGSLPSSTRISFLAMIRDAKWTAQQHAAFHNDRLQVLRRKGPHYTRNAHKSHAGYWLPAKKKLAPAVKPADLHLYEPNWQHLLTPKASLFLLDGKRCLAWDGQRKYLGVKEGTNEIISSQLAGGLGASYENTVNETGEQCALHSLSPPGELAEGYLFAQLRVDTLGPYGYIYAYPHTTDDHRLYLVNNGTGVSCGLGTSFYVGGAEAAISAGDIVNVCFSWRVGFVDTYLNGKVIATDSVITGGNPGGELANYTAIGCLSSAALSPRSAFDGTVNILGIGDRHLSASEAKALTANPYQILKLKTPLIHSENIATIKSGFALPDIRREHGALLHRGRKPTAPMVINEKHKYARGMQVYSLLDSVSPQNLVRGGSLLTFVGSASLRHGNLLFTGQQDANYIVTTSEINPPNGADTPFDFTLSIRVKVDDAAADRAIYQYDTTLGSSGPGFYLKTTPTETFQFWFDGGGRLNTTGTYTNTWVTLTFVGEGASGNISMYVDGILDDSNSQPTTWLSLDATGMKHWINNGFHDSTSPSIEYEFFSFQHAALSASEVVKLHEDPYQFLIPKP